VNRDRIATGFNSFIEKHYDYGVIGNKNTYALDLDLVINKEEFNNPISLKLFIHTQASYLSAMERFQMLLIPVLDLKIIVNAT